MCQSEKPLQDTQDTEPAGERKLMPSKNLRSFQLMGMRVTTWVPRGDYYPPHDPCIGGSTRTRPHESACYGVIADLSQEPSRIARKSARWARLVASGLSR